tara:strand:- start:5722 stop:6783 length:1062 start_codon:yes stop_codon:yes gene_type:complete
MNMNIKNILYIGDLSTKSNSMYRLKALERLGYEVKGVERKTLLNQEPHSLLNKLHYRTGYVFLQKQLAKNIKMLLQREVGYDLIWINAGEYHGPQVLKLLKETGKPIVLYNNDDPTGGRDGQRFRSLLKAIPFYDVCAVMRDINVPEYKKRGAQRVLKVLMSYDELQHQPFKKLTNIPNHLRSEVAFIGTYIPGEKRDAFFVKLLQAGIPLSLWGNSWEKSKLWSQLKPAYRGAALSGRDYVGAIQGAKICLGMLSKGNRDLYTRRSVEIPFAGGLLCAERTTAHENMYQEGQQAVFWEDAAECILKCKRLLQDETLRETIRSNGMQRVRQMPAGNEQVCSQIINAAEQLSHA